MRRYDVDRAGCLERGTEGIGEPLLAIGIGLNYGPAVLGDVGSEHSFSFTVIGDTVNTASRLQALTRSLETPLVVGDALVCAVRTVESAAASSASCRIEASRRSEAAPARYGFGRASEMGRYADPAMVGLSAALIL